jgi:hypothetical protein
MARQIGPIPLKGTIDGITFYEHPEDGHLARKKSRLTRKKVLKHRSFKQFRAYSAEFQELIFAGELLRNALRHVLFLIVDGKLSSRMNASFFQIVQFDKVNGFGKRLFTKGNIHLLKGFDFNCKHELGNVFTGSYITGQSKTNNDAYIGISPFDIATNINLPEYATHFQFMAGRAIVDFENGKHRSVCGTTNKIPINQSNLETVNFTLSLEPGMEGIDFLVLGIAFYAELKNIPRDAISGRKRMKLKRMADEDGLVKFSGTAKIVRVGRK